MAGTYGFAKSFPVFRLVLRDCHALLRRARNDKLGSLLQPEGCNDKMGRPTPFGGA